MKKCIELIKVANGYVIKPPHDAAKFPSYDRMFCFETLEDVYDWLTKNMGKDSEEKETGKKPDGLCISGDD